MHAEMKQALMLEQLRNNDLREKIANGALPNAAKKPAAKKKMTKDDAEKTCGNLKCSDAENDLLLNIVEDILPIGKFPWEKVGVRYNNQVLKTRSRTVENLRKHFNIFVNEKPPTGDPDCPPLVKRAKRIDRAIKDKAGLEAISAGDAAPDFEAQADGVAIASGTTTAAAVKKKPVLRKSDTAELVDAMIASEKMAADREERREE